MSAAKREIATLSREEYKARLDAGQKFRGGYLYELDTVSWDQFFWLQETPQTAVLKRRIV